MSDDMTAAEAEAMFKRAGGVAFPSNDKRCTYLGMTLRDYFAGQALAGLIANPDINIDCETLGQQSAKKVYDIADAMLREREVK